MRVFLGSFRKFYRLERELMGSSRLAAAVEAVRMSWMLAALDRRCH